MGEGRRGEKISDVDGQGGGRSSKLIIFVDVICVPSLYKKRGGRDRGCLIVVTLNIKNVCS